MYAHRSIVIYIIAGNVKENRVAPRGDSDSSSQRRSARRTLCLCSVPSFLFFPVFLFPPHRSHRFVSDNLRLCKLTAHIANFLDRIVYQSGSVSSVSLSLPPILSLSATTLFGDHEGQTDGVPPSVPLPPPPPGFLIKRQRLPLLALAPCTVSKLHILTRPCRETAIAIFSLSPCFRSASCALVPSRSRHSPSSSSSFPSLFTVRLFGFPFSFASSSPGRLDFSLFLFSTGSSPIRATPLFRGRACVYVCVLLVPSHSRGEMCNSGPYEFMVASLRVLSQRVSRRIPSARHADFAFHVTTRSCDL